MVMGCTKDQLLVFFLKFAFVIDELTRRIEGEVSWTMSFVNDIF